MTRSRKRVRAWPCQTQTARFPSLFNLLLFLLTLHICTQLYLQTTLSLFLLLPFLLGVFFMSYGDFRFHFRKVYVCRLFEGALDLATTDQRQLAQLLLHRPADGAVTASSAQVPPARSSGTLPHPSTSSLQPSLPGASVRLPGNAQASEVHGRRWEGRDTSRWLTRKFAGLYWEGKTAAGCPRFIPEGGKPELNPQYLLRLVPLQEQAVTEALLFLSLAQEVQVR